MKNRLFFKIIAVILLQAFLLLEVSWAGTIDNFPTQRPGNLSPQIVIHTPLLQQAYLKSLKSALPLKSTEESNSLPEWLNTEGLAQMKDLKIEKRVLADQVSVVREHDVFDDVQFHITYKDKNGFQKEVGFVRFWVYKDTQGARLFSDTQDNFNIQVVSFLPKLPHSKGTKRNGEVVKAGLGISLLWFLLVHEFDYQGKNGLIYNASKSSKIAFGKLKQKWPSIDEFMARPFLGKTVNTPPMRNIKFEVLALTPHQKKEVKDFLENKISFVDEQSEKINVFSELETKLLQSADDAIETLQKEDASYRKTALMLLGKEKAQAAQVRYLAKDHEIGGFDKHVDFPGLDHDKKIWQMIRNPLSEKKEILRRQNLIKTLIDNHDVIRGKLQNSNWLLSSVYELLSFVKFEDENKKENKEDRVFSKRNAVLLLEMFAGSIQDILSGKKPSLQEFKGLKLLSKDVFGNELTLSQHMNNLQKTYQGYNELKNAMEDIIAVYRKIDDPLLQAITDEIEKQLNKFPIPDPLTFMQWVKDNNKEDLQALKAQCGNLLALLERFEIFLSFAEFAKREAFNPATFDEDREVSYRQGWNPRVSKKGKKKFWSEEWESLPQIPNDSGDYAQTKVYTGSNMSGKSWHLKQNFFMQLFVQAFGWVSAESGNFHIYDRFAFIDRADTDSENNLSAFANECTFWLKALQLNDEKSKKMRVYMPVDEGFSTTSPEDQALLLTAAVRFTRKHNMSLELATHNEEFIKRHKGDDDVLFYYFKVNFVPGKEPEYTYMLKQGVEDSHALEVAESLGLQPTLTRRAWEFIRHNKGKTRAEIKDSIHKITKDLSIAKRVFPEVETYSSQERERLKKEKGNGFLDFFPTNDVVVKIEPSKEDRILPFRIYRDQYEWKIFDKLEKKDHDSDYEDPAGFRSRQLPMPKGYAPVFKVFSQDAEFSRWGTYDEELEKTIREEHPNLDPSSSRRIHQMIMTVPALPAQKVLEKQRMFDLLESGDTDLEALVKESHEFEFFKRMIRFIHPEYFDDFNLRLLMGVRKEMIRCFKKEYIDRDREDWSLHRKVRKICEMFTVILQCNLDLTGKTEKELGIDDDLMRMQQLMELQKTFAAIPLGDPKTDRGKRIKQISQAIKKFHEITGSAYMDELYNREHEWAKSGRSYKTKVTDTYLKGLSPEERKAAEKMFHIRYWEEDERKAKEELYNMNVHMDFEFGENRKESKTYSWNKPKIRQWRKLGLYKDKISDLLKEQFDDIYAELGLTEKTEEKNDEKKDADDEEDEKIPHGGKIPPVSLADENHHAYLRKFFDKHYYRFVQFSDDYSFIVSFHKSAGWPALLFWTKYIIEEKDIAREFFDKLRAIDSVYLNQFANYLEDIWSMHLGGFRTGLEYLRILRDIHKDVQEAKEEFARFEQDIKKMSLLELADVYFPKLVRIEKIKRLQERLNDEKAAFEERNKTKDKFNIWDLRRIVNLQRQLLEHVFIHEIIERGEEIGRQKIILPAVEDKINAETKIAKEIFKEELIKPYKSELRDLISSSKERYPDFSSRENFIFMTELSKLTDILTCAKINQIKGKSNNRTKFHSKAEIHIKDGVNPYSKIPIDKQIPNDSYFSAGSPGELATGTNASGKTHNGKANVWDMLESLAMGRSSAGEVTMPNLSKAIFFDRVTTKLFRTLSAWGTEVHLLKQCLEELLTVKGPAFVFIDELGSSTSPKYQSAVSFAVAEWFLEGGIFFQIASHNHDFLEAFVNAYGEYVHAHHFKTRLQEDGTVKYDYIKQPGHEKSNAIAVAKTMGLTVLIDEIQGLISEEKGEAAHYLRPITQFPMALLTAFIPKVGSGFLKTGIETFMANLTYIQDVSGIQGVPTFKQIYESLMRPIACGLREDGDVNWQVTLDYILKMLSSQTKDSVLVHESQEDTNSLIAESKALLAQAREFNRQRLPAAVDSSANRAFQLPDYLLSPLRPEEGVYLREQIQMIINQMGGISVIKNMNPISFGRQFINLLNQDEKFNMCLIDIADKNDYEKIAHYLYPLGIGSYDEFQEDVDLPQGGLVFHKDEERSFMTNEYRWIRSILRQGNYDTYIFIDSSHPLNYESNPYLMVFHEIMEAIMISAGRIDQEMLENKDFGHCNLFVLEQEIQLAQQLGILSAAVLYQQEQFDEWCERNVDDIEGTVAKKYSDFISVLKKHQQREKPSGNKTNVFIAGKQLNKHVILSMQSFVIEQAI